MNGVAEHRHLDVPDHNGDDEISVEELQTHFDSNEDGVITTEEFIEKVEDKIDKEIETIRNRRLTKKRRRLLSGIEDYTLLFGVMFTAIYFGILLTMSSGILGDSTEMDHSLSETFLDTGEVCDVIEDTPWLNIYSDNDRQVMVIEAYNLNDSTLYELQWQRTTMEKGILGSGEITEYDVEFNMTRKASVPFGKDWHEGEYNFIAELYEAEISTEIINNSIANESETNDSTENNSANNTNNTNQTTSFAGNFDSNLETIHHSNETVKVAEDDVIFKLEMEAGSWGWVPGVDAESTLSSKVTDAGARVCWGTQDLGNWAWGLMGAELGGGRETAMLTGGSAGIPAWWMAFVSLSLSVLTLFILYPLIYKVYHQEADDKLTNEQIERVVELTLKYCAKKMQIKIEWDIFRFKVRELSIDVLVAYRTTDSTIASKVDVRAEILKEILNEFGLFRVFKPVLLVVKPVGEITGVDFEHLTRGGLENVSPDDLDSNQLVEDYTDFFKDLHDLSRIEDVIRDSLLNYLNLRNMTDRGTAVLSDDHAVFVRVIYRPNQRFAFFRFKQSSINIEQQLREQLERELGTQLADRELIISARNEIATLSDRSQAGRIETSEGTKDRVAAVARQDGFAGRVLQTKFFGDMLSTVEYTAQEKREFINKWGFWGLIVFVWIPFMASGVLVGAVLGMLSRMKFDRVLWATLIGGSVASITWAYTAEGIVTFMHKFRLEAIIPIAIIVFIGMAVLHLRSTKSRRQTELFEDTMVELFKSDIESKFG
ncbi:MAG TPA: small multi-drug export protein [Candidatus Poseidoniaceae archaeon]|nr:small multi-drug export protein [Candidatus Poseidoniaceae archaeon]